MLIVPKTGKWKVGISSCSVSAGGEGGVTVAVQRVVTYIT